jgi:nucleotide-binding universal stress UspA family protein
MPELQGPDAHVVGQMVRRARCDLIVTGIPRHSRWQSLIRGDGVEKLRRVAPCPILNVPELALESCAHEICN